ncbi:MAG TPA: acylneuraminate cytidylyltransferase family protein [Clostridia bacterium]|nr:acylneuraminate cytidylyltransferase family protein [Clostridia bacterium]
MLYLLLPGDSGLENTVCLRPLLAIIPARGGSTGFPGKNTHPFAGLPLIAHSIRMAQMTPEVDECIVTTDSEEIAEVARRAGGKVPFMRPADLARDETPIWPVLQHALREMEQRSGVTYGSVLLLQPTNPAREISDVAKALEILAANRNAMGVIAVSEPPFNPRSVCVEERAGYMHKAFPDGQTYARRQDAPKVFRINGVLYLWRRDFVFSVNSNWDAAPHKMLSVPPECAVDIDTPHDLLWGEFLIAQGKLRLPWLQRDEPR